MRNKYLSFYSLNLWDWLEVGIGEDKETRGQGDKET
jgi:hypothetical protein